MSEIQLLLLRHEEVASHRGNLPVTEAGQAHAEPVGKAIRSSHDAPSPSCTAARRTHQTAETIARGISVAGRVEGSRDNFALRNSDIYLAGTRVNMVSSATSFVEQAAGMTFPQVEASQWNRASSGRSGPRSSAHRSASGGGALINVGSGQIETNPARRPHR